MPKRTYSKEYAQKIINMAKDEGCLVSYNHPVWSQQNYNDYAGLKGIWGVEWHNTDCTRSGTQDSLQPLRDLWQEGELVYPLATDDCHGPLDLFGGWIQVKAKKLDYTEVFHALKRGAFYSSNGPTIKSLYVEDGVLHVKTSKAERITVISNSRWNGTVLGREKPATEAAIDLTGFFDLLGRSPASHTPFIRVEVVDKFGKRAITRPYAVKELR